MLDFELDSRASQAKALRHIGMRRVEPTKLNQAGETISPENLVRLLWLRTPALIGIEQLLRSARNKWIRIILV